MDIYYYDHDTCETYCELCAPTGAEPAIKQECDYPQHCYNCETLLDHKLTLDGENYVREKIRKKEGRPEILDEWAERWDYLIQNEEDQS